MLVRKHAGDTVASKVPARAAGQRQWRWLRV